MSARRGRRAVRRDAGLLRRRSVLLALAVAMGCRGDETNREPATTPVVPSPAAQEVAKLQRVPGLEEIRIGASEAAEAPNIGVGPDGAAIVTWIEVADGGGYSIRMARRGASGWSAPTEVVRNDAIFPNWADFPAVVPVGSDRVVATWLERASKGDGYGVRWKQSQDAGTTWSDATRLHEHEGGPEYGFVSLAHLHDGAVAAFWLDGRESKGHAGGQMQLRSAVIRSDGSVTDRRQIDARVCDCCQTAAASTASGPVVVYRDRSESEVRDIAIAGPGEEQRRRVSADRWTIAGCPVNGPGVSARDDELAVAWFTGADDVARVRVAFGGAQREFGPAIDVSSGEATMGRVDIEWLGDTDVVVSYLERGEAGVANIVARRVDRSGAMGPPALVGRTASGNASGFPRMARTGGRLLWAWTAVEGSSRTIRVVEAAVAGLQP